MPTYVYGCTNETCWRSKKPIEIGHPLNECGVARFCRECGAPLERRIAAMPLVLWPGRAKGREDGWYDYVFPGMSSVSEKTHWGYEGQAKGVADGQGVSAEIPEGNPSTA